MAGSYWAERTSLRLSRRRAIAAGAAATGAALLAACGGGKGSGGSAGKEASSGLVTKPVDTTQRAKRGGVMKDRTHADIPSLDVLTASAPHNSVGPHVYSSLLQFKPGYLKRTENEVIGDLAESWEWSPDGLSIVMRLRPNVKWHNKAPVNGRAMTMDDILFSWDRFSTKSSVRTAIANVADPSAPIVSLTATDAKTVVVKLKEPLVYAPWLLAANSAGNFLVVPKERDSGLDLRGEMVGTGPFVLTKYTQSAGFTLTRNPDFYDPNYAQVDQVDMPIVAEYAAALSQFKAGNIYHMGSSSNTPLVSQEDILQVHRDEPRI